MNWAYLAGFTDGDGCISIEHSKGRYVSSRIRWAQKESDAGVLCAIGDFLRDCGFKVTHRNFSVMRAGHKYPQMELCVTNAEDTRQILHKLLPYLIVKYDRAKLVLEYLDKVAELKAQYGNKYRQYMQPNEKFTQQLTSLLPAQQAEIAEISAML